MYVIRFAARDFRNLEEEEIFPCEEVNIIYGDNAQGKTNLLEGMWLFTGGHSFRGAKDTELPRIDPETGKNLMGTALALDFYSAEREQSAMLQIENGRRSAEINGVKKDTGTALVGKVRAVIFSPEHLLLVKEGPTRRRNYLDTALCQLKPSYASVLTAYRRALMQRNALLKEKRERPSQPADTLSVWNARLARLGAQVVQERQSFTESVATKISGIYDGIARGRERLEVRYCPSVKGGSTVGEIEELFVQELSRTSASDIRSGFTSVGPHRDDLDIEIDGVSARSYGSQGQQRSAVLAMKLAEAQILTEFSGESPIVLLDDVMSELDRQRQDYLLNHLQGQQVFITCCSPETVELLENGMRFHVDGGAVYPEEF
ncbi:MAG: DNA replication/repair protein RecF [Acutalibacter sp.]|jgi:DNA replication and repair protein RecF|uniref:DNA replication/repair protein RecF n=1 Tax=Acutalibacter sp. TaxID=1918636 RepID=UPI00216F1EBD|nr:DNA replication/repair protein RecF [Acutalibacter sp.]MCI9226245.1 DNA replication/repair protein RecF [Acutalibacter sp.]